MKDYSLRVQERALRVGARRTGHYRLNSGVHSEEYFDKKFILNDPVGFEETCRDFAELCASEFPDLEALFGPERGGADLAKRTAEILEDFFDRRIVAIPALKLPREKEQVQKFYLSQPDVALIRGLRAVCLEDVTTSGSSILDPVQKVGEVATVLGAIAMVRRGRVSSTEIGGGRLIVMHDVNIKIWTRAECKLHGPCSRGVPINTDAGRGPEPVDPPA